MLAGGFGARNYLLTLELRQLMGSPLPSSERPSFWHLARAIGA